MNIEAETKLILRPCNLEEIQEEHLRQCIHSILSQRNALLFACEQLMQMEVLPPDLDCVKVQAAIASAKAGVTIPTLADWPGVITFTKGPPTKRT